MSGHFFAPDHFQADGFVIRPYRPGDGRALQIATNESYKHLKPWMPWASDDVTLEEAESRCRRFAGNYLVNQDFVLGIWIGEQLMGGTGFHLRHGPVESGNAEIGMWIRGKAAGQGLGTRALAAMLEWGFGEWKWERLIWKCDVRNVASARVAEKCGLTLEGTLRLDAFDPERRRRSTHVYAILAKEWRDGRKAERAPTKGPRT